MKGALRAVNNEKHEYYGYEKGGSVNIPNGITTGTCTLIPADFFFLFFTPNVFLGIKQQTNTYRAQTQERRTRHVKAVVMGELYIFLGLMIAMGVIVIPNRKAYWRDTSHPIWRWPDFNFWMTRTRFDEINMMLHVNDNLLAKPHADPARDKLHKVRPIITQLEQTFKLYFRLGCHISVDEAMLPFKGRTSLKQYMPKKPVKWGFKLFMLCDKSGYVHSFKVYVGRGTFINNLGLTYDSVVDLCRISQVYNSHRILYTDRYYTSVRLYSDLLNQGIYAVGTAQTNRKGYPKDELKMKKTGTPRGTTITRYTKLRNAILCAVAWMDKKPVYFLATTYFNIPS